MQVRTTEAVITSGGVPLTADVATPPGAGGIVVFAHGSGSSRRSPRNVAVAQVLNRHGLATVLVDLLTPEEGLLDERTAHLRFDIGLLGQRLVGIVDWLRAGNADEWLPPRNAGEPLPIGLFGASTGAAAALVAAAERPEDVSAVVSRGGRPDLAHSAEGLSAGSAEPSARSAGSAQSALARVRAATLLLVGGRDEQVLRLNEQAMEHLGGPAELRVVPGATHLFEEPGALEQVAHDAAAWFTGRLAVTARRVGSTT